MSGATRLSATRLSSAARILPACRAAACILLLGAAATPSRAAGQEVDDALSSMSKEVAEVRHSCNEPVEVKARLVGLSDRLNGVHVVLKGGACLGWFGRYDYLLVRDGDGAWQTVQDGGPGVLDFVHVPRSRFTRIDIAALMGCSLSYTWSGSTYLRHASPACAGGSKTDGWRVLEKIMRASEGTDLMRTKAWVR